MRDRQTKIIQIKEKLLNLLTNFLQPIESLVTLGQNLDRIMIFIRIMIQTEIKGLRITPKAKNQLRITTITTTTIIITTMTTMTTMKNITTTNPTKENL